jgi:transketolase
LANRIDRREVFTFAIVGDGETNEGQVWEAAMFAAHAGLGRLIAFTDNNKMQIDGLTADVSGIECLQAKWSAFGWETVRIDGHDVVAIATAIGEAKARADGAEAAATAKPTMIILDTIKGKGAAFCEGQVASHNMNFDYETAKKAIADLDR